MKINLYQRQHPQNLSHVSKPLPLQHNPYSMTSSNSSIDFALQPSNMRQVAVCEEPLFIVKQTFFTNVVEKPLKIRLKLDRGILQFSNVN